MFKVINYRVPIKHYLREDDSEELLPKMLHWCRQNCLGDFRAAYVTANDTFFYFDNEQDVSFFKLRWPLEI